MKQTKWEKFHSRDLRVKIEGEPMRGYLAAVLLWRGKYVAFEVPEGAIEEAEQCFVKALRTMNSPLEHIGLDSDALRE